LHKQADRSNQELAEKVALSASVCFQRTKALKEAGYFINFQTEMDLDRICEHVLAYVEFNLHSNTPLGRQAFELAINKIPEFIPHETFEYPLEQQSTIIFVPMHQRLTHVITL
jgi:Lrp/AsnC family leucine-responsive transcriptional regulator